MQSTKTKPKIDSPLFIERYQELKQILIGLGPRIAAIAGTDVLRWNNAIRGQIKSPELLQPLYEAMEEVAREEQKKLNL